jgi:hypothetical protein
VRLEGDHPALPRSISDGPRAAFDCGGDQQETIASVERVFRIVRSLRLQASITGFFLLLFRKPRPLFQRRSWRVWRRFLLQQSFRPFLPAFGDPRNGKQPLDLVPITGIDAKYISDR